MSQPAGACGCTAELCGDRSLVTHHSHVSPLRQMGWIQRSGKCNCVMFIPVQMRFKLIDHRCCLPVGSTSHDSLDHDVVISRWCPLLLILAIVKAFSNKMPHLGHSPLVSGTAHSS